MVNARLKMLGLAAISATLLFGALAATMYATRNLRHNDAARPGV